METSNLRLRWYERSTRGGDVARDRSAPLGFHAQVDHITFHRIASHFQARAVRRQDDGQWRPATTIDGDTLSASIRPEYASSIADAQAPIRCARRDPCAPDQAWPFNKSGGSHDSAYPDAAHEH
uniref:MOSC_N domain-containing protein n=1 Tax=Haemonchus contortus TaxID=6289 RepID=A0A7I4XWY6_HAECO